MYDLPQYTNRQKATKMTVSTAMMGRVTPNDAAKYRGAPWDAWMMAPVEGVMSVMSVGALVVGTDMASSGLKNARVCVWRKVGEEVGGGSWGRKVGGGRWRKVGWG